MWVTELSPQALKLLETSRETWQNTRDQDFSNLLLVTTSVVTSKPATCGHFKSGHFGGPET
jgi:hypothetical protein